MLRLLAVSLASPLLLAACGDPPAPPRAPAATQATPEAAFEAIKAATLAEDWEALYLLHSPSERAEAEQRWEAVRADPAKAESLERLAGQAGTSPEALAEMDLRLLFVLRNTMQAASPGSKMMEATRGAAFLGAEPVLGEGENVVMVRVRTGEREMTMPFRREDGRWYLWRVLTGLTDL
jgi:hypothetical protein